MGAGVARVEDRWTGVLGMLALAVAYFASAKLGLSLATVHGNVSPVWPPTGVAIAGLLLLGVRAWPALWLGCLAAVLPTTAPPLAMLGMATGNTLEAVVAVLLLRRVGFSPELGRVRDVLALALGAAVGSTLVSTLIGMASLCLTGSAAWADFGALAWTWWVGNAMGALVVTPVLLLRWPRLEGRRGEALLLAAAVLLVCLEVFRSGGVRASVAYAEAFLLFPLVVWAALRFGARGAVLVTLMVATASIWGTVLSQGPFAHAQSGPNLLVLQLFLGVTALTGLLLAAATAERQRVTERLQLLAATVRAVREGVLISERGPDGELRIVFANESFCELLGYTLEELVGRSPRSLAAADGLPGDTRERLEGAIAGRGAFLGEVGMVHKDGRRVASEAQVSLVRDAQGVATHVVSTHRDVAETKALQAKLLAAERFASVGTLAAGVGHEINNPLAYLVLSLESAARALSQEGASGVEEALGNLRSAEEGAERIRLIVRDLKTFSREGHEERARVDLREVVAPALRMTRHALRHRARLLEEYGPVPRVEGNEARLGQVLLNLLVNAVQAIPEGDPERHAVRVRTGTEASGQALVEVSDTGCGIPADVLPRIFDPFFTTKPSGEGTGLGLSICHQIVKAHGGELRVRSEAGRGTTFTMLLPPAPALAEPPAASEPKSPQPLVEASKAAPASDARRGRVLIIDDEPRLAHSMRLLLEPSHDVVTTTRGSEALALVSEGQHFDVVLCDLQMPETSGMDVYAQLRARAPQVAERLVFLSGGAYTPAAREFVRSVPNRVLEKPVRPETLLAVVDAALA
jgi:PAS domain S-box-containing protein